MQWIPVSFNFCWQPTWENDSQQFFEPRCSWSMIKALCCVEGTMLRSFQNTPFATTKQRLGASCYSWIFDPISGVTLTSKRIVEDIHHDFESYLKIHENKEAFIDGLANRIGHWKLEGRNGKGSWGGVHEEKTKHHLLVNSLPGFSNPGIGHLHQDLCKLIATSNISKATANHFVQKSSTKSWKNCEWKIDT